MRMWNVSRLLKLISIASAGIVFQVGGCAIIDAGVATVDLFAQMLGLSGVGSGLQTLIPDFSDLGALISGFL